MSFSSVDEQYMRMALSLAQQGEFTAHPNPCVGCVIVQQGKIVGYGLHWQAGHPHAECNALSVAGEKAHGATCYVTLEPCAHQGRTAPCTTALIQAGVRRVIFATVDPNPQVQGKGARALREAGIEVSQGLLANLARALNKGFFCRMQYHRPYVRVKMAMSVDGRVAMASGESQWITGEVARKDAQVWRARSGAILTTHTTVNQDNCRLTVREFPSAMAELPKNVTFSPPWRIVIDSQLQLLPQRILFGEPGKVIIVVGENVSLTRRKQWMMQLPSVYDQSQIEWVILPQNHGHIDINMLLSWLADQAINEILIEAGPTFLGGVLQANIVDELIVYLAPILLGSKACPLAHLPDFTRLDQQIRGKLSSLRVHAEDLSFILALSDFAKEVN